MNSFKLKNLGSRRSVFAQTIVWRGRRGSWGKLELVWLNQRFVHPSLVPISPVLQLVGSSMLCNMLGERSCMSLQMVSLKDLPHTYPCTYFYSKGRQYKQELYRFWITGESNFYWGTVHEMLKCLSFILLLFSLYNFFIFLFIMANYACWVTLQGGDMNEDAQGMWNLYLMELTNRWTKMQELSSIFIKPNLTFCSAWFLVHLSPSWTKECCMSVRVFTLVLACILFIPCKRLVNNKYSRNA